MQPHSILGFSWNRDAFPKTIPAYSVERVTFRFHKMLAEFVWDAAVLEGNPHTLPEVKTLLEGITVGGRKIQDQEQILNLGESCRLLLDLIKQKRFALTKGIFCMLNATVARNEALEWGHFRGEGKEKNVKITVDGWYIPPAESTLNELFHQGVTFLNETIENPLERAIVFFLFGALSQFFFDGNKRSSRLMMNGSLMSEGIDAISVPAARALEFNQKMAAFYKSRQADEMIAFLIDCYPEKIS